MPSVRDDGTTVEIDLHGARLHEAERLLDIIISEASRRGRTQLRVIHGASTFGDDTPSIKGMLYRGLDERRWPEVTSAARFEGHSILSLPIAIKRRNSSRITMLDII
jgi:DNA-nicking Smr family endonuclease